MYTAALCVHAQHSLLSGTLQLHMSSCNALCLMMLLIVKTGSAWLQPTAVPQCLSATGQPYLLSITMCSYTAEPAYSFTSWKLEPQLRSALVVVVYYSNSTFNSALCQSQFRHPNSFTDTPTATVCDLTLHACSLHTHHPAATTGHSSLSGTTAAVAAMATLHRHYILRVIVFYFARRSWYEPHSTCTAVV
jgi:hypothetical protein